MGSRADSLQAMVILGGRTAQHDRPLPTSEGPYDNPACRLWTPWSSRIANITCSNRPLLYEHEQPCLQALDPMEAKNEARNQRLKGPTFKRE